MKNLIILPDVTLKQALNKLNKTGAKCLVVADSNNKLLGTLSDGDIRKSILKGIKINTLVDKLYNNNPKYFIINNYTIQECKKAFIEEKFDLIPVIKNQKSKIIIDILFWDKIFDNRTKKIKNKLSIPIVVMAGGKGSRLEPFTKVLPKPLVPINEKPIIEHIIDSFTNVGCTDFFVTVDYKAKILKAYFEELNPNYRVNFINETDPLGTAGSLGYIDNSLSKHFLITNCDIIIKADYTSIYNFHLKQENDITLVASAKEFVIPYGTCELNNDGNLLHINEKPKYDYLINTGLYIINSEILKIIPKNKFYHITHLIEDSIKQGKKVGVFPVDDEAWVDIGQWAEYQKAIKVLNMED